MEYINRYIDALCMKYGTHIFNSIDINSIIESTAMKYGTYIFIF